MAVSKTYDLVRVFTSTTGTGTVTLGAATSNGRTFSSAGIPTGTRVSYGIIDGADSEVGTGFYSSTGPTLTRTKVYSSTQGGSKLNLSGNAIVYVTVNAQDFTWLNSLRYKVANIVRRNWLTSNSWISSTSAADNSWRGVRWSPELGLFCAVSISGAGNRVMTSPDGITWTIRTSAADNQWYSVCWSPELGLFCAVASTGTGNRAMTSKSSLSFSYR